VLNGDRYRQSGQQRYAGEVMRSVTLTDGTRGDFVVKVRPSGLAPSVGPEWVPIVETDGRVRPENVLYQVEAGSLTPVRDARLEANISVARERATNMDTVVEFAPTTPIVIVRPNISRDSR
jgi:hypothetical protein